MSDVALAVHDARLPAHSIVLAVRSQLFATMLQTPMREAKTKEIALKDIDAIVARWVLRFHYAEVSFSSTALVRSPQLTPM